MQPADELSWKYTVWPDHSHQSVGPEPEREWGTHPVPAQPVCVCAEQHERLSEHGEGRRPAHQPAGVRRQPNSFFLAVTQVLGLVSYFYTYYLKELQRGGQNFWTVLCLKAPGIKNCERQIRFLPSLHILWSFTGIALLRAVKVCWDSSIY